MKTTDEVIQNFWFNHLEGHTTLFQSTMKMYQNLINFLLNKFLYLNCNEKNTISPTGTLFISLYFLIQYFTNIYDRAVMFSFYNVSPKRFTQAISKTRLT